VSGSQKSSMNILITVQRDATQSSLFISLQFLSTCFGCQSYPSSRVHKTVTAAFRYWSYFVQLPPSNVAKLDLATLEGGSCTIPKAVVNSFVYS